MNSILILNCILILIRVNIVILTLPLYLSICRIPFREHHISRHTILPLHLTGGLQLALSHGTIPHRLIILLLIILIERRMVILQQFLHLLPAFVLNLERFFILLQ